MLWVNNWNCQQRWNFIWWKFDLKNTKNIMIDLHLTHTIKSQINIWFWHYSRCSYKFARLKENLFSWKTSCLNNELYHRCHWWFGKMQMKILNVHLLFILFFQCIRCEEIYCFNRILIANWKCLMICIYLNTN